MTIGKKTQKLITNVLCFFLLVVLSLTVIMPLWYMFSTSVKSMQEIMTYPPTLIPKEFHWSNFAEAWFSADFTRWFFNSLLIAIFAMIGGVLSNSFIAYGFAKLRFPGRKFLFSIVLATLMIPEFVRLVPQYVLFSKIGWVGTYLPLIIPQFVGTGYFIFMLRQFYMGIPNAMIESAQIDGANHFYIWWKLILPTAKPALLTVLVLSFNWSWSDFLKPLLYITSPQNFTLQIGLKVFVSTTNTQWNHLMAASCIVLLPIILLFLLLQKYFLAGMNVSGAVKG